MEAQPQRSTGGARGTGVLLLLVALGACAAGTRPGQAPQVDAGAAPGLAADAGVLPGAPPARVTPDAGACPAGMRPCCDGHCGTPLECAQLACDPSPRLPVEER